MKTSKYQQAMDQVNLSPEADERISAAIEAARQEQKVVSLSGGRAKRVAFRLCCAAVIAAMLAVSAMAVSYYHSRSLGKVEDVIINFGTGPRHDLTIPEAFASPDAPETIQEYYLPTAYISADNLEMFWVDYRAKNENGTYDWYFYEPTSSDPARRVKESPLLDTPTDVYYFWDATGKGWSSVIFSQTAAKYFDGGSALISIEAGDSPTDLYSFELDGYEVYVFAILDIDGSGREVMRTWYWTDGNYLFTLCCFSNISDEAMTKIFRSVRPVGGEIPYLAEFQ